jgi:hypothetical protein
MKADEPGKDKVEPQPPTCYDCTHHGVCKFNAAGWDRRFPFKDDHAIAPYLKAITTAQAAACSYFTNQKEPTK